LIFIEIIIIIVIIVFEVVAVLLSKALVSLLALNIASLQYWPIAVNLGHFKYF